MDPKDRMKTLSHEHLHCRGFGSALLDVGYLVEWLATKRLRCPVTLPAAYVQVEWLLAAIQRHTEDSVTGDEAREIVTANARLREHRCATLSPAWLLGGEAYIQWASLIREGVDRGELVLLDFSSKLPIQPEQEKQEGSTPEWIVRAQTMAAVMIEESLRGDSVPRKEAVSGEIATLFLQDGTRSKQGRDIDSYYIERHALKDWRQMVTRGKRKIQP
jgi:hypothetical protein